MSLVLQSLLPYPHSCQGTSPHQQGWDTKMAMLSFCGVDVSKDRLDVVVLPEGWFFSVSNDTAGWAGLVARLSPLNARAVAHQAASRGEFAQIVHSGARLARRQDDKAFAQAGEQRMAADEQRDGAMLG